MEDRKEVTEAAAVEVAKVKQPPPPYPETNRANRRANKRAERQRGR